MAQNNSGNLVWFVAGAAIGSALTLLYAPQSGRDTRRLLGRKAKRGSDALADAGRDALDKGRDLYEKGRRVADEAPNCSSADAVWSKVKRRELSVES